MQTKTAVTGGVSTVAIVATIVAAFMMTPGAPPSSAISLVPTTGPYYIGDYFNVNVMCTPGTPIKAYEFKITFNPVYLQAMQVSEGTMFTGYQTFFNAGIINNTGGSIKNIYGLIIGQGLVSTPGQLVSIQFKVKAAGSSAVTIYGPFNNKNMLTNASAYVPVTISNTTVTTANMWDMNGDGMVDLLDITSVASHYGETGAAGWIIQDVVKDGKVNVLDIAVVASHMT
jgi:hypothetical protein